MKYIGIFFLVLTGMFFMLMISPGLEADEKKVKQALEKEKNQNENVMSQDDMPVYKPPRLGVPLGRVGGGARGTESEVPVIVVLVPDHIGLTIQNQPVLYWYLSKPTDCFVEFTLNNKRLKQTLLEKPIDSPVPAGIQRIRLADYGIRLSIGEYYEWLVALVPDPENRTNDIVAHGYIEVVDPAETLSGKISGVKKEALPHLLAEEGIWYDSLSAIYNLIDAAPDDGSVFRQQRDSLLKQVGLGLVVKGGTARH